MVSCLLQAPTVASSTKRQRQTAGSRQCCLTVPQYSRNPSNHRITGWKRPPRSSSPTVTPTTPCLLQKSKSLPCPGLLPRADSKIKNWIQPACKKLHSNSTCTLCLHTLSVLSRVSFMLVTSSVWTNETINSELSEWVLSETIRSRGVNCLTFHHFLSNLTSHNICERFSKPCWHVQI